MDNGFAPRRFFVYLGIALIALIAIAAPLGLLGPTKTGTSGYTSAVKSALADATANNATSDGAPQQAVVNGWLARDLMEIQINQNNDQIKQNNDELVLLHLSLTVLLAALLAIVIAGTAAAKAKRPGRGTSGVEDDTPTTVTPTPTAMATPAEARTREPSF